MTAQTLSIQSAKNDFLQIGLPNLDSAPLTYLTESVAAAGVTLTVKDNTIFAQNKYVIIGTVGGQQTEIKRITAAVTAGTSLTVAACTFAHPVGTPITQVIYDQVEIYGSASAADAAPTLIGTAVNMDVARGFTEIKAGTTYAYYYCRAKDSNGGTYSSYSDSVLATGLTNRARGEIKKEYLSAYNNKIDDLITDDWLNRTINRWQRELSKRRKQWSNLRAITNLESATDVQAYALPTDIQDSNSTDAIVSVKFSNQAPMTYLDQTSFMQMTQDYVGSVLQSSVGLADITVVLIDSSDFSASGSIHVEGDTIAYTGNTKSTGTLTGVTGISATHAAGKEVWETYTSGTPNYYTVDAGYLKAFPVPNSAETAKNIILEYWAKYTDLVQDSDETSFNYPENCLGYMFWQESIRRRLPMEDQIARKREWQEDLENMVANDPQFKDCRIVPTQAEIYTNPY